MKKLFHTIQTIVPQLIVFALAFGGSGANAQSPYPYAYSYAGIPFNTKSIVRNYNDQHVVVYYEESGRGYVSLVNVVSNNVITVPLDEGYYINDMCIMNDSVFLCGKFYYFQPSIYYIGCIVTMNLNSFYSSSVMVTRFEPSYWIRMNIKRMKWFDYIFGSYNRKYAKFMVVCDIEYPCDGSEPFPLSSFHEEYGIPNNPSMCLANAVMEVSYPFTPGSSVSYTKQRVLRPMNPNEHTEIIHDVVVTDHYVAYVGIEQGSSNAITLHVCNKSQNVLMNIYPSPPYPPIFCDFDNYYTFPLSSSNGNPFYRACALDGDKIAIATHNEISTSSNSITIRTFDLATHTMSNAQELQCIAQPDLKDIVYLPKLNKIVLLFYDYFRQTSSYCDIFCTVDPYNNTNYTTSGITDKVFYLKFGSLDALTYNYFITTGGKYGFASDASLWGGGSPCYYMENYNVLALSVISAVPEYFDYDQYCPTATIDSINSIPVQVQAPVQCIEN